MMACMYAWLALVSAATYAWLALVSAAMCKCACAWPRDKWTESLWLGSLSGIPNALKAWKQRMQERHVDVRSVEEISGGGGSRE